MLSDAMVTEGLELMGQVTEVGNLSSRGVLAAWKQWDMLRSICCEETRD